MLFRTPAKRMRQSAPATGRQMSPTLSNRLTQWSGVAEIPLKALPFALAIPGAMLWTYLREINALGLFPEVVGTTSGLGAVLIMAIFVVGLLLVQMCLPSIAMVGFLNAWEKPEALSHFNFSRLFCGVFIVWVISLAAFSYLLPDGNVGIIIVVVFVSALAIAIRQSDPCGDAKKWGMAIASALAATFPALASCASMLVFSSMLGKVEQTRDIVVAFILVSVMSFAGYLPALFYLPGGRKARVHGRVKHAWVGLGICLMVLIMFMLVVSPGISSTALRLMGVYADTPRQFEIKDADLVRTMRRVGIDVPEVAEGNAIASAYVRFAFGDIRFLCRDAYTPGRIDGKSIFLLDSEAQRDAVAVAHEKAAKHCLVVRKDEVRAVSL